MTINSIGAYAVSYTVTISAFMLALLVIQFVLDDLITVAFGLVSPFEANSSSKTPINHVIVISQGERSFDNYFGTFPGANGFPANLTVPLNPFSQPLREFTMANWFNTNITSPKIGFLINKGGVGVDTPGKNMNYGVWMDKNGTVAAGFETTNGSDYYVSSNGTYNDGRWHNVVVTYDGNSELRLYIDGSQIAEKQTGGAIPEPNIITPIRIGSNSFYPNNYFTGFIDEVRLWNRTLDDDEILKGYTNNTFDTRGQLVYSSFTKSYENSSGTNVGSSELGGIYLNGSSYLDIEYNNLLPTPRFGPFNNEKTITEAIGRGSEVYKTSYNKGLMNGFLFAQESAGRDPNQVIGYYDSKQLPYYWKFASEFALADNFFAPSLETGLANQQYLYTGTSVNYDKKIPFRGFINLNWTIFDELQATGHSWKVYVEDYDPALNYTAEDSRKNRYNNLLTAIPRFVDNKTLNSNIVDLDEYFRDLQNDTFPALSYIVGTNSEETAPKDVLKGQEFVSSLVLALMKSKHWNDSAFILTYRESGGWYDHVRPPIINDETYGFRVPTLIISPYAKKGHIDSTIYDVTSILKFIEYNYGLSALSKRDASANNILSSFDFSQPPTKPILLNYSMIESMSQDTGKNMSTNGENSYLVKLVYLVVLISIPVIAVIIYRLRYSSKESSTYVERT